MFMASLAVADPKKKLPADPGFFVYHVLEMLIHTPVLSEAINQI